ncbi:hypothetical protein JRO89_XS12G0102500 [Xanthoceras sorbifolium]|uniref:Uncharacterized protein n=1 Tax=Xanthoceras sorbifolium TaxID=99658 RepID=A0ABQ8HC51_9ROSI|nr:hypothetical protein JRO89_XS12G0102500 [Xanthoceras sorbifolium]
MKSCLANQPSSMGKLSLSSYLSNGKLAHKVQEFFFPNCLLGNPLLDLVISILASQYLWWHGAISDETLRLEKTASNESKYLHEICSQTIVSGMQLMMCSIESPMKLVVIHDRTGILLPSCTSLSRSTKQLKPKGKHGEIHI